MRFSSYTYHRRSRPSEHSESTYRLDSHMAGFQWSFVHRNRHRCSIHKPILLYDCRDHHTYGRGIAGFRFGGQNNFLAASGVRNNACNVKPECVPRVWNEELR